MSPVSDPKELLRRRVHADYHYVRDHKKADRFEVIRHRAKDLAMAIVETLPLGREMDEALVKVEEACMHASAGIARERA